MRATRLFNPNINPSKPHTISHRRKEKKEMNVPKEGSGSIFGEQQPVYNPPPATGGSYAPPFAPGGPENPYPPSAGMPAPNVSLPPGSGAMQPGFMGSGAPGSQAYNPQNPQDPRDPRNPQPPQPIPGQTSGPFSGPGFRPGQYPMPTRQPVTGGPMQPGPMQPPQQSGIKPKGIKTIPPPEGKQPPKNPPQPPGQWITVDAGKGLPPAYGFLPHESDESTDTGLGEDAEKKQQAQAGQKPHEQKGHYVALQMPKKPGDDEPTWCWIPEIGSDYGVKKEEGAAKPPTKS